MSTHHAYGFGLLTNFVVCAYFQQLSRPGVSTYGSTGHPDSADEQASPHRNGESNNDVTDV